MTPGGEKVHDTESKYRDRQEIEKLLADRQKRDHFYAQWLLHSKGESFEEFLQEQKNKA